MRFLEKYKPQLATIQALNNTTVTPKYFDLAKYRCITVILIVLAMAATKTAKIEFVQDKDGDGGDVKDVTGAEKTVTANTSVIQATVDLSSVANTDVVTINGIAFAKAAATDEAAREFADAAGLVACVNHATYGVAGVTASGTVTLTADDGYTVTVSKTENAGTITLATTQAIAAVDIRMEDLDTPNGFTFVAPKITTTANATAVAAVVIAGEAYNVPVTQATPNTIL